MGWKLYSSPGGNIDTVESENVGLGRVCMELKLRRAAATPQWEKKWYLSSVSGCWTFYPLLADVVQDCRAI